MIFSLGMRTGVIVISLPLIASEHSRKVDVTGNAGCLVRIRYLVGDSYHMTMQSVAVERY